MRVLEFGDPPRIGYSFNPPNPSDIAVNYSIFASKPDVEYREWGRYPELLGKLPGFSGEVCRIDGNIYGRLDGRTKGECVRGALEDGWEDLGRYIDTYVSPYTDKGVYRADGLSDWREKSGNKFSMVAIVSLQAIARDARKMDNMLADTVLETENLKLLVNACADAAAAQADILSEHGVDSAIIYDDWGLQHSLYINPESWREIWKEPYARVIDNLHKHGMKFFLHSCGLIRDIIDDFVEIGVDAFQFDQPALYNFDDLSGRIGGKAALWSPVDIQKFLPTGNREIIRAEALRMIKTFHRGGGLIAMDYGSLDDIGVKDEWAQYARDVFLS
jgi:hypothetical protein